MHNSDYLREQAENYRRQAELALDAATRQDLLECAAICEEVANKFDDMRTAG